MAISTDNQRRMVLALIGITTIMAGLFTWRAGQLASSAAFEDRTSIGQTIKQSQQDIEVGLGAVNDTSSYVRYVADYAEAAAIDDQSAELAEQGAEGIATYKTEQADSLRASSAARAAAAGVFGRLDLYADLARPSDEPRPFDFEEHLEVLETEAQTGLRSPGRLDPDYWAQKADDTRSHVYWLRVSALVLLAGVFALTVAQITERTDTRLGAGAVGVLILVGMSIYAFVTVFRGP